MVDINLLGEEEKSEPVSREESFNQGIGLETPGFSKEQSSYISEYPELTQGRGNARLYIIIGALLVIVVLFVYFILPKGEKQGNVLETLSNPEQAETLSEKAPSTPSENQGQGEAKPPGQTGLEETGKPNPVETNREPGAQQPAAVSNVELSPIELEMLQSKQLGRFTIGAISNAVSGGATITLISYSDGSFMAEFVASSDNEMANIINRIRQDMLTADLKLVHQENYPLHGPNAIKALVTGSVTPESASSVAAQGIQYVTLDEFLNWARNVARANGLSVKTVHQSTVSQQEGYAVTPFQMSLDGSLRGAVAFLNDLDNVSPNLKVDKISLINKDPRANTDDAVTLVMFLRHYAK